MNKSIDILLADLRSIEMLTNNLGVMLNRIHNSIAESLYPDDMGKLYDTKDSYCVEVRTEDYFIPVLGWGRVTGNGGHTYKQLYYKKGIHFSAMRAVGLASDEVKLATIRCLPMLLGKLCSIKEEKVKDLLCVNVLLAGINGGD